MFVFSDVLKLLQIHLRNSAEIETCFFELILQKELWNRAFRLRHTWEFPYAGLQGISRLDLGCMLGLVATGNNLSADMQDLGDVRGTKDVLTSVSQPSRSSGEERHGLGAVQTWLHEKFSSGFAALLAGCGSCFLIAEPQSPHCVDKCPDFS